MIGASPRVVSMKASDISDFAALFDSDTMGHDQLGTSGRQIITPWDHKARPSQLWHGDGLFFSLQPSQTHKRRAFRFPPFVDFLEVFGASDFAAALGVEFSFGFGCLGFSAVALPAMRRLAFLRSLVLEKLPKVVFMDLSYSVAIFFSSCRFFIVWVGQESSRIQWRLMETGCFRTCPQVAETIWKVNKLTNSHVSPFKLDPSTQYPLLASCFFSLINSSIAASLPYLDHIYPSFSSFFSNL